jgi:hypothetical protein
MQTVVAAMEYEFIGGSMGVVVGEKIARNPARDRQRGGDRVLLGRRPDDRRPFADADGEGLRGPARLDRAGAIHLSSPTRRPEE